MDCIVSSTESYEFHSINLPHLQIPEMKPILSLSVQLTIEPGHRAIHVCLEALAIEIRVILRQLGNRKLELRRNLPGQTKLLK